MMVGLFEPRAAAWSVDGIPATASFTTLKPDWDRMAPFLEARWRACRSRSRSACARSSAAPSRSRPT